MKVYQLPIEMVNALRSWFHPKDRSIIMAPATFFEGEEIVTPAFPTAPGSPAHNRGRLYWKNGYWTSLDEDGQEQILPGLALISETILNASASSVTFLGIPQIFRNLMLMCQARTDAAAESDGLLMRCNGDTGANYDRQLLTVNNATLTGLASRGLTFTQIGTMEAANSRASNFPSTKAEIFGYSRTDNEKWVLSRGVAFGNVSADADLLMTFFANRWRNTTAISSLTLLPSGGPNFVSGSRFQLYGVN